MNLARLAAQAAENGTPVRAGLIGAGKFGSMFLSQVPSIAGLEVTVIADLDPARQGGLARRGLGHGPDRSSDLSGGWRGPGGASRR